uniref:CKLF-like MARVEL transmembrane domain containing 7 n=1 Tax=Labrus bergylta TaxID=56723 RepID=A0A3Q3FE78_9LABR
MRPFLAVFYRRAVALLVAFLCVRCARGWPSWAAFQYFEVVSLWFLIALLIFFLMHLFRLQGRMPCINWPLTEFFHYSVGTVLILIASIIAAVKSGGVSALVVASVFGFIATFLMAVSLWTTYSVTCGVHQTGKTAHRCIIITRFIFLYCDESTGNIKHFQKSARDVDSACQKS